MTTEFHAEDWFTVTGRGRVAAIKGIEGFEIGRAHV